MANPFNEPPGLDAAKRAAIVAAALVLAIAAAAIGIAERIVVMAAL